MSDQHRIARELFHRERMAKRAAMSVGRRIDVALTESRTLSAMTPKPFERHSPSAEHTTEPPDRRGMLLDPERENVSDAFARRIGVILHALEREVDAHKYGVSVVGADPMEQTMEERDRRLVKWVEEGMTPSEISFLDPGQGSARTVERQIERLRADETL